MIVGQKKKFKVSIYCENKLSLNEISKKVDNNIYMYLDMHKNCRVTILDLIEDMEQCLYMSRGDLVGNYKAVTLLKYGYIGMVCFWNMPMTKMKSQFDKEYNGYRLDVYLTAYYLG